MEPIEHPASIMRRDRLITIEIAHDMQNCIINDVHGMTTYSIDAVRMQDGMYTLHDALRDFLKEDVRLNYYTPLGGGGRQAGS